MERGYLCIQASGNGRDFKLPTVEGTGLGIVAEKREIRGEMCYINLFGNEAQRFILEELDELIVTEA